MAMNPRLLRPKREPLLLDFAPGAAAAYSLRQLSSGYAGPVVTVRRSSDNAEDSFTAGEVSDGTLAAWVGSGNDGFVKTWHSQTGSNDATQTTTANQPQIVDSGNLVLVGSSAAIEFDGTNDRLLPGFSPGAAAAQSLFLVIKNETSLANFRSIVDARDGDGDGIVVASFGGIVFRVDSTFNVTRTDSRDQTLLSLCYGGSSATAANDGASTTASAPASISVSANYQIGWFSYGSVGDGFGFDGFMQELIIYPSDQSANRQRIEGNIAWSYS